MACACVDMLQSLCLRLKGAICRRRSRMSKVNRHSLKISEPFDFKHVSDIPKGFDSDEMNAFCERAAASRMIAMEDQPSTRPSSSNQHAGGITFYSHGRVNGLSSGVQAGAGRPQQVKSRAGYRGLASSSAAASRNNSLAYVSLTESRPSLTHSFAATVDSTTPLAPLVPTNSYTTTSSASFLTGGREGRSLSSSN